jgi:hypothetical protein
VLEVNFDFVSKHVVSAESLVSDFFVTFYQLLIIKEACIKCSVFV